MGSTSNEIRNNLSNFEYIKVLKDQSIYGSSGGNKYGGQLKIWREKLTEMFSSHATKYDTGGKINAMPSPFNNSKNSYHADNKNGEFRYYCFSTNKHGTGVIRFEYDLQNSGSSENIDLDDIIIDLASIYNLDQDYNLETVLGSRKFNFSAKERVKVLRKHLINFLLQSKILLKKQNSFLNEYTINPELLSQDQNQLATTVTSMLGVVRPDVNEYAFQDVKDKIIPIFKDEEEKSKFFSKDKAYKWMQTNVSNMVFYRSRITQEIRDLLDKSRGKDNVTVVLMHDESGELDNLYLPETGAIILPYHTEDYAHLNLKLVGSHIAKLKDTKDKPTNVLVTNNYETFKNIKENFSNNFEPLLTPKSYKVYENYNRKPEIKGKKVNWDFNNFTVYDHIKHYEDSDLKYPLKPLLDDLNKLHYTVNLDKNLDSYKQLSFYISNFLLFLNKPSMVYDFKNFKMDFTENLALHYLKNNTPEFLNIFSLNEDYEVLNLAGLLNGLLKQDKKNHEIRLIETKHREYNFNKGKDKSLTPPSEPNDAWLHPTKIGVSIPAVRPLDGTESYEKKQSLLILNENAENYVNEKKALISIGNHVANYVNNKTELLENLRFDYDGLSEYKPIVRIFSENKSDRLLRDIQAFEEKEKGSAVYDAHKDELEQKKHNIIFGHRDIKEKEILKNNQKIIKLIEEDTRDNPSHYMKFLKDRGISEQTAQTFGIGFASSGNSNDGRLDKWEGVPVNTGLSVKSKGFMFRNRIIIPIRDEYGQMISLSGRIVEELLPKDSNGTIIDKDKYPKYLNGISSDNTPLFQKENIVFGISEAKESIQQEQSAILVEGYLDAIKLHDSGIKNAVAVMGASFNTHKLNTLFKRTDNITLMLDGDDAGRRGAYKAAKDFLTTPYLFNGVRTMKFVMLPKIKMDTRSNDILKGDLEKLYKGLDPDEYINLFGVNSLKEEIDNAIPLDDFIIETIFHDIFEVQDPRKELSIEEKKQLKTDLLSNLKNHAAFYQSINDVLVKLKEFVKTKKEDVLDKASLEIKELDSKINDINFKLNNLIKDYRLAKKQKNIAECNELEIEGLKLKAEKKRINFNLDVLNSFVDDLKRNNELEEKYSRYIKIYNEYKPKVQAIKEEFNNLKYQGKIQEANALLNNNQKIIKENAEIMSELKKGKNFISFSDRQENAKQLIESIQFKSHRLINTLLALKSLMVSYPEKDLNDLLNEHLEILDKPSSIERMLGEDIISETDKHIYKAKYDEQIKVNNLSNSKDKTFSNTNQDKLSYENKISNNNIIDKKNNEDFTTKTKQKLYKSNNKNLI